MTTTPLAWVPAIHGHELALDGTDLRCRKTDGRLLKSVPGAARRSPAGERLEALREQLVRHETQCRATVESWLLSGIPVPAPLLARVWPDPAWRTCLRYLVARVGDRVGLLEEVSEDGRVCVREADGALYEAPAGSPVTPAHPVLLDDLAPWRGLLEELGATQGIEQVSRQVHRLREGIDPGATGVEAYGEGGAEAYGEGSAEGSGAARRSAVANGFDVRGGFAVLGTTDLGVTVQARCWVGSGEFGSSGETGRLLWVDEAERPVPLGELGPVAWSEGRRMAEIVYGGTDPRGTEDR